jgi:hypothetical protein
MIDIKPPLVLARLGQRQQMADDFQRIPFGASTLGAQRTRGVNANPH